MGSDNQGTELSTAESHVESVETVLRDILGSQNVATIQELDLTKISDDQWERLGDAVMELRHPGEAHQVMDSMMGGEGSESLRQMHINMGRAYLGYGSSNSGQGMMMGGSTMGGGMMGNGNNRGFNAPVGMMGFGPMMGFSGLGGFGVLAAVTWVMAIAFLTSGAYFFLKKAHKN